MMLYSRERPFRLLRQLQEDLGGEGVHPGDGIVHRVHEVSCIVALVTFRELAHRAGPTMRHIHARWVGDCGLVVLGF